MWQQNQNSAITDPISTSLYMIITPTTPMTTTTTTTTITTTIKIKTTTTTTSTTFLGCDSIETNLVDTIVFHQQNYQTHKFLITPMRGLKCSRFILHISIQSCQKLFTRCKLVSDMQNNENPKCSP